MALRLAGEMRAIRTTPLSSWDKEVNADCAVVLTGGPGRVREGFDLLADRHVKKLIISGVHPDARLRDLMPNWTFHHGLKEEDVVLEKRSETTWGNAQQSLPIVEALRCRDIVLVTSRAHMRRAFRTFRSAFPESILIQTQAVVGTRAQPAFLETVVEALKSMFYSLWAY
ncbi:MAG: YdcF family protein [Bdellovibrionaceae bacterium]|nr:YdcF family protein [Pseudobdellovibrionaceae bacterium]MBX3034790.1 YdcF family protein [Pseudobdellovibrionaceae bacterium]